jgi:hypothetical protein
MQTVWRPRHDYAPPDHLRQRKRNLDMDKGTSGRDTAYGPAHIPNDWFVRPQFHLWPPQKRRATLWVLVHMIWFRTQMNQALSAHDYSDFLQRARWKAYQATVRQRQVGRYLELL